jgi:hypothetical protein
MLNCQSTDHYGSGLHVGRVGLGFCPAPAVPIVVRVGYFLLPVTPIALVFGHYQHLRENVNRESEQFGFLLF